MRDNRHKYRERNIWLGIDFVKVKQRIDQITAQFEEVQRKYEAHESNNDASQHGGKQLDPSEDSSPSE